MHDYAYINSLNHNITSLESMSECLFCFFCQGRAVNACRICEPAHQTLYSYFDSDRACAYFPACLEDLTQSWRTSSCMPTIVSGEVVNWFGKIEEISCGSFVGSISLTNLQSWHQRVWILLLEISNFHNSFKHPMCKAFYQELLPLIFTKPGESSWKAWLQYASVHRPVDTSDRAPSKCHQHIC